MGENEVLQPRSIAIPLLYGNANKVVTEAGVATVRAPAWLPEAQFETSAVAASSAPGFRAAGSTVVVVVAAGADVVVVDPTACVEGAPPDDLTWT